MEAEDLVRLPDVWKEWQVQERIGTGSFGSVYKAEHVSTGSISAIKILNVPDNESETEILMREFQDEHFVRKYYSDLVKEFVHEIETMDSLKNNDYIVSIEGYHVEEREDEIGWRIYIRMEYLQSFSDYSALRKLTEKDVIQLGIDICCALEQCEKLNIIHRDIKPDNILVSKEGRFKLCDFGIARQLDRSIGSFSVKGTFSYMAPEIYTGKKYGFRVDIYSLGIVLYRLMNNNREPFVNTEKQMVYYKDKENALNRRMNGEPLPAPRDASPEFTEIILKASAFTEEQRYADAGEMRKDLELLKEGAYTLKNIGEAKEEEPQKADDTEDKKEEKRNRHVITRKVMAIVLAVCVLGAAIFVYNSRHKDTRPVSENTDSADIFLPAVSYRDMEYAFSEDGTVLKISGHGDIDDSTSEVVWSDHKDIVQKIVIEDGVTVIGGSFFADFTSLTEIEIPDSVKRINASAFEGCTSLEKIRIPDGVEAIGESAFAGCEKLREIEGWENVKYVGEGALDDTAWMNEQDSTCKILNGTLILYTGQDETLSIPDSVRVIAGEAFRDCRTLKEVGIPGKVKVIGDEVFANCSNLSGIYGGEGVVSIGYGAFRNTVWLEEQNTDFPAFNGIVLEYTGGDNEVTIPDGVTGIAASAFCENEVLTKITIPDTVTYIGEYAFYSCSGLKKVQIPKSVKSIGEHAFDGCSLLEEVEFAEGLTSIDSYAFFNCVSVTEIQIPKSLERLGDNAFNSCVSLISVELASDLKEIESYTFAECIGLKEFLIPDSVVVIGNGAFRDCECLMSVQLPEKLEKIGNEAFKGCSVLEDPGISSDVNVGRDAFAETLFVYEP